MLGMKLQPARAHRIAECCARVPFPDDEAPGRELAVVRHAHAAPRISASCSGVGPGEVIALAEADLRVLTSESADDVSFSAVMVAAI